MKSLSNFIAESSERVDEALNPKRLLDQLLDDVIPENYDEEDDPEGDVLSEMTSYVSDQIESFREEMKNKKDFLPSYVALYYAVVTRFYTDNGFVPATIKEVNSFALEQAEKFRILDEPIKKALPKNFYYGRGLGWENIEEIIKSEDEEPETVKELLDFFAEEIDHYL